MIQRIQTLWLFLIALLAVWLFFVPVMGKLDVESPTVFPFSDLFTYSFIAGNGLIAFLSLTNIFLYKNRSLQIKICYGIFFLLILLCAVIGYELRSFQMSDIVFKYSITFPVIAFIFDILAVQSIKKDEKLVRSLDRLR